MTAVFERILEMSLTAAVVIVVVMLIRLLLRKAPRKYAYALWSVAAFRLVCPVSFRAFFSLFNFTKGLDQGSMESILPDPIVSPAPVVSPGYFDSAPPNTGAPVEIDPDYVFTYPVVTPPAAEPPAATPINWVQIAAIIWLIGLAALLIYGIVSYVRLRRRMDTAVRMEDNVWQSDRVQSPFILGFVRPKIYLPFGLSADQQRYVLAHERYHLKSFDHIVRPVSFLILAVHWFNPLVWVAYYMMGRDMEMSCDEKVLSGGESVKDYSTTLLSFAANRRFPSPSPLAFGESGVKGRIKNALNWKKPRTWVTIIAILVCIVVIVVCAANPKEVSSETERLYDRCNAESADTVDMAYIVRNGQWSERLLSEEERETIAAFLNDLSLEDFEVTNAGEWFHASSGVRVDTSWGTLYWYEGRLYTAWTQFEGGTRTFYWEIENQTLSDYVGKTIGGISHTLQNSRTPDEWAKAITAEDIQWAELMINGENPICRSLTDSEIEALLILFNGGLSFSVPPQNGAWAFPTERKITLCCGGIEYVLNLGPEPMTILCTDDRVNWKGEDTWFVNSDSLKHIIRQMPAQTQLEEAAVAGCIPYVSTKCVYQYPTISASMPDDSGKIYLIGEDRVAILDKKDNDAEAYFPNPASWQALTPEEWSELFWDVFVPDISDYKEPRIRWLSEQCALADLDGTLWILLLSQWESGVSDEVFLAYELAPANETVTLAQWQSDLTHDGVDENITLTELTAGEQYVLTVTDQTGKTLWKEEAGTFHVGWNGFYLYERAGKHYLLEWFPNGQQGWYNFNYKIYRLNEDAEPEIVEEDSLLYDLGAVNYRENILTVDVEPLRAFEKKINALLKDAQVLLVVDQNKVLLGNPSAPVSDTWTSPADEWEREQQYQIAELPLAWAGWEGDLNLLNCVEEQTKLRMGNYELAYVDSPKEVPIADIDTTGGHFIYRVEYRPADYDAKTHQLTWHDNEYYYLITHEDSEDDEWHFVGTLTEEELQSRFNTPEMLDQYSNDPYLAAAVEMVKAWREE